MEQLTAHDPRRIGPFEVLGRLGAGGMGLVYLGRSAAGRRVAIKTVRAELAEDQLFRVRFSREIAAAKKVSGFYTAAVVDADADAPLPWLATAYVPAPSLEDLVAECGPLPVDAVRWLTAGIAEALQSIHQVGLVHRDLKPSNVLVTEDGPRVIDFGIAAGVSHTRLTMTNVAVGTPAYMSPEQARDSRGVTAASDVFSLGSLVVYAATGHAPYHGVNPVETVFQLLRDDPDLTGLPRELDSLVRALMRPAPEKRVNLAQLQAELAPQLFARGDEGGDDAGQWLPPHALDMIERRRQRRGSGAGGPRGGLSAVPDAAVPPQVPPRPSAAPAVPAPAPGAAGRSAVSPAAATAPVPFRPPGGDAAEEPAARGAAAAAAGPAPVGGGGRHGRPAGLGALAAVAPAGPAAADGPEGEEQVRLTGVPLPIGPGPLARAGEPEPASAAAGLAGEFLTPDAGAGAEPSASPAAAHPASARPAPARPAPAQSPPAQVPAQAAPGQAGSAERAAARAVGLSGPVGGTAWTAPPAGDAQQQGAAAGPAAAARHARAAAPAAPQAAPAPPAPASPAPQGRTPHGRAPQDDARWRPWRFRMSNDIWGAPVAADGTLFVNSFEVHALDIATGRRRFKTRDVAWVTAVADGRVHAADGPTLYTVSAADGSELWRTALTGWVYAIDAGGGAVCVGSRGGGVQVRSAIDGSEMWRADDAQQEYENPQSGPCVVGESVYYQGGGRLRAVDLTTGRPRWELPVGEDVPSRPVLRDGVLYVTAGSQVLALDEESGAERWRAEADVVLFSAPVLDEAGTSVFVADYLGTVSALDAAGGALRWRARTGARQGADPVVYADGMVLAAGGDTVFAFDAADGAERWRYAARGEISGAPAVADGLVHVGSRDHSLHTLDLAGGRLRWKLDTGGEVSGSPLAAGGRVFACSKDRCVYALDAAKGTAR